MWSGQDKVWLHYRKDIMAADVQAASFLSSYLRNLTINKSYSKHLEVVDLQKYKVIKRTPKVSITIKERGHIPFVFIIGKN